MSAPIGEYMANLAKLLENDPAPWTIEHPEHEARALDAKGKSVVSFDDADESDKVFWEGIVAAVNLAAGLRPW